MTSLFDTRFKVGTVTKAENFDEAEIPEMFKLWIDLGAEKVQSAARL